MTDLRAKLTEIVKGMHALGVPVWPISKIVPYENNPVDHTEASTRKTAQSILDFGFNAPILVDELNVILYGHGRRLAAMHLGLMVVPVLVRRGLTEEQKQAYRIVDNRAAEESDWNLGKLKVEMEKIGDKFDLAFNEDELEKIRSFDISGALAKLQASSATVDAPPATTGATAAPKEPKPRKAPTLEDAFSIPPASVFDTRSSAWKARAKAWGDIAGTGIDDPVLAELAIRWFCPPAGSVLDPFAGTGIRAAVASRLGREFHGVVPEAGKIGALLRSEDPVPNWYGGDISAVPTPVLADLLLICPNASPELEAMQFPEFVLHYRATVERAAAKLKLCRFAVFVVGDVRAPDGGMRALPAITVDVAESSGLRLQSEAALVIGGKAGKAFAESRKLSSAHLSVLIFAKGDPTLAVADLEAPQAGELEAVPEAA